MHFVEKPGREGLNSTRPIKEGFEWGKAFVQMVWMSQSYDDHNEQTAKSLRVLIYLGLSLTAAIWSRYFCYSYFADGVTEVPRSDSQTMIEQGLQRRHSGLYLYSCSYSLSLFSLPFLIVFLRSVVSKNWFGKIHFSGT